MDYYFIKRLMDIAGSILGLIILSPIFLLTIIAVKLESLGPVFYAPTRVGRAGKLFKMYKFRSMKMYNLAGNITHADEILRLDSKLLAKYKKSGYKLTKDPRLTRIGSFLRKFSIDELPQLINVIKGEMSLVGPRAYLPEELSEQQKVYPKTKGLVKTLLLAKPGMTGFWQVSGRSKINFENRIEIDAEYVRKHSLLYDLKLLLKTIPAVIQAKGAV